MELKAFFDSFTSTLTYIVFDGATREAVIIDPVLDYNPKSSVVDTKAVREVVAFATASKLKPLYVLETHAHADHLSGAQALKQFFPDIRVAINERIVSVQETFKKIFHLEKDFPTDGSQFDQLLKMGETYRFGRLQFKILPTPGHTPACSSFVVGEGESVFTGDALFMPDSGTGRCDFPSGSAADLYESVTGHLYTLPKVTRVFVGHDYQPGGRGLKFETTIAEEKEKNIRLNAQTTKAEFIAQRNRRDGELEAPQLLYPSLQVNIRAGTLPEKEANGERYFKVPLRMG